MLFHEHIVHFESGLRGNGFGHINASDGFAVHIHLQCGFHAYQTAAYNHHPVAHIAAVAQRLRGQIDVGQMQAGNGTGHDGTSAGGPENVVRGECCHGFRRGLLIIADGDLMGQQFPFEIANHAVHIHLEPGLAGIQCVAAQMVALFPELHGVAGLLGVNRCHAAAGAAADDQNFLRLCCFRQFPVAALMAAAGVHGAGGGLAAVYPADAALVAGNAGANFFRVTGGDFIGQVWVSQQAAADDREVADLIPERGFRFLHIAEPTVGHYGDIDHLLDDFCGTGLQRHFLNTGGGHGQIPVFVAAGVNMQRGGTVGFQQFGQLDALVDGAVIRLVHVMVRGELDDNGEIRAAYFTADVHELFQEPGTIFQTAAVFIGTMVPAFGQKLVGQIAAVCVNFHAVCAAAHGAFHALAVIGFDLMNFVYGQLVTHELCHVQPRHGRGTDGHPILCTGSADSAFAGHNLCAHLAAVSMAALHHLPEEGFRFRAEENGVLRGFKGIGTFDVAENHGGAAFCALYKIFHHVGVHITDGSAHGGHDHTVFQFHCTDFHRLCQKC